MVVAIPRLVSCHSLDGLPASRVKHTSRDVARWTRCLQQPPAPGSSNTSQKRSRAEEDLRSAASPDRTSLHKAAASQQPVRHLGLRVKTSGDFTKVDLVVQPAEAGSFAAAEPTLLLVTFTDVATADGGLYNMCVQPYRTVDNVIEGEVITFVDVTEVVQTREALKKATELSRLAVVSDLSDASDKPAPGAST